jgi:hypothetical protein
MDSLSLIDASVFRVASLQDQFLQRHVAHQIAHHAAFAAGDVLLAEAAKKKKTRQRRVGGD